MYSIVPRQPKIRTLRALLLALCISGTLVACGDSLDGAGDTITTGTSGGNGSIGGNGTASSSSGGPQTSYTIGGNVMGLSGTGLVLANNAGNNLTISGNGGFTFAGRSANGARYAVTVVSQPVNPQQVCTVSDGVGTVGTVNVASVIVSCTTNFYTVGGSVTGLVGSGLVVQTNASNNMSIASSGNYVFSTLASGSNYTITVMTQPSGPTQTCVVTNGTGIITTANVTNVAITCTIDNYTISGTVSGLSGAGLVVQTNGANNLPIPSNGDYTFATLPNGTAYTVTVLTQPTNPTQVCTVTNGTGTINGARFTNVIINCVTQYTISAHVTGLAGTGLVLYDNGGNPLAVTTSGTYPFTTTIAAGGAYAVTVHAQPTGPAQVCTPTAGAGTATANVTVAIACVTQFTISADVSGLTGTGLVLYDNGGDALTITGNGTSPFATKVASGSAYAVTVHTQPTAPAQFCTVTAGTGTATAAVTVQVGCKNVGKFVFVTNAYDGPNGSIIPLAIDPLTGSISAITGPLAATDAQPLGIALDPTGSYAYVPDNGSANVDTYNIAANGALSYNSSASAGAGSNPLSVAVDTTGGYVYAGSDVTAGTGTVGGYTSALGVLTPVAAPYTDGDDPKGLVVDPANSLLFAANIYDSTVACYPIGAGGTLGAITTDTFQTGNPATNGPYALAIFPGGGYLYVTDSIADTVTAYSYSGCGTLTQIGVPIAVGTAPESVAVDSSGKYLYVANSGDATVSGFTINASTGALTSTGAATATGATASADPTAVAIEPSSQYVYVANGDSGSITVFKIGAGGVLTIVGAPSSIVTSTGGPSGIAIE